MIQFVFVLLGIFFFQSINLETLRAEEVNSQKQSCEDSQAIYKKCSDQNKIFSDGYLLAKKNKKLHLIKYGFENCPWCQSLHKLLEVGELKEFKNSHFISSNIDITTSSGKEVFSRNKGDYTKKPNETGFPFLVIINAENNKQVYLDPSDLEDNTNGKGHDIKKLKSALEDKINLVKK
jgi:thioredoxin-related protein